MTQMDWPGLLRVGLLRLRLKPCEFWALTPAELALKFNAPLVPTWGIRQDNGLDFEIHIEQPIAHSDPATMTQEMNDRLEVQIRKRMGQWLWIHRRWKDGTGPLAERGAKQLEKIRRDSQS